MWPSVRRKDVRRPPKPYHVSWTIDRRPGGNSMPRWHIAIALAAAPFLTAARPGGEYNEVLKVGDAAPAWSGLEGIDGKKHALSDLKDKEVVVVVFTCNSCDIAVDYEERIIAFTKKYA